jgi:hypothetical protein
LSEDKVIFYSPEGIFLNMILRHFNIVRRSVLSALLLIPASLLPQETPASAGGISAGPATIKPGKVWLDDRGKPIQAHGGGIAKFGDTWFWYGEDRTPGLEKGKRAVACYSSTDLIHWKYRNRVFGQTAPPDVGPRWVLERPKVFFNARTKKFVMWMHIDGPWKPDDTKGSTYALARVGVAICDTPDGEFKYLRSFRPLGQESRDIGQFIDDDGSAYLIFESRPTHGFFIAKLSDDYLDVKEKTAFIKAPLEGGALVHYQGLYYVVASYMSGWDPNPNQYATAQRLEGPWSGFKDIAPHDKRTYGSQSTMLLKVVGTKTTSVIFMGDMWNKGNLSDSRYLWMPLEIGDGKLHLPPPKDWALNARTGEVATEPPFFSAAALNVAQPNAGALLAAPPALPAEFASVAEAQKEALRRYPDLGVAGSKFNAAFVARYQLYQQQRPGYFQDISWPLRLAEEVAQNLNSSQ